MGRAIAASATSAAGEGQTSPAGVDGTLDASPLPQPISQPVTAIVGNLAAPVLYAGDGYGEVAGVFQVNMQIPNGDTRGQRDANCPECRRNGQSGQCDDSQSSRHGHGGSAYPCRAIDTVPRVWILSLRSPENCELVLPYNARSSSRDAAFRGE